MLFNIMNGRDFNGFKNRGEVACSFFRRGVNEIRAFLRFYAAYIVKFLTAVSAQPIGITFKCPNPWRRGRVSKRRQQTTNIYAAWNPRKVRISETKLSTYFSTTP